MWINVHSTCYRIGITMGDIDRLGILLAYFRNSLKITPIAWSGQTRHLLPQVSLTGNRRMSVIFEVFAAGGVVWKQFPSSLLMFRRNMCEYASVSEASSTFSSSETGSESWWLMGRKRKIVEGSSSSVRWIWNTSSLEESFRCYSRGGQTGNMDVQFTRR